ncbi:hypothetical protein QYQ99_17860 [Comamonas testosteroni]|uniref:hypothetical protein n=1 Tax=Comamonas testosteroni TaxID=285 RepID=UPI00265E5C83|nr:hypothetical protein [Comamonas testosteroni]WKL14274.1 hypothetical protein QYQ99_17860 [Comamonas testosteroni]
MTWQTHQLLAGVNLAICLGIGWACICRLNSHICRTYLLARARYTLLLVGALASGMQPLLFNSWPSVASVIFGLAVLAGLGLNVVRWWVSSHPMRRSDDE